ncbi:MAG: glutamine--fructose-6-phosphate transaminase (isomerizing) [Patescibacteria group bacterium]
MCGIVGYIGEKKAQPILLDGLRRMEYRGYDSAGVAVFDGKETYVRKKSGKLANLIEEVKGDTPLGTVGIAHTRWATHGAPNDINAHPHQSSDGSVYLIHNGIIENYKTLKEELLKKGFSFSTDTDTEVLANLIASYLKEHPLPVAVEQALKRVEGAYGMVAYAPQNPDTLVAARLGSPLILGIIGEGEYLLASDVAAIIPHTRNVIYLDEGEMVTLTKSEYRIQTFDARPVTHPVEQVQWNIEEAEKGGFAHFMLKEIMEQPDVVLNGLRGRVLVKEGDVHLGALVGREALAQSLDRVVLLACGSAAYAAHVGEYMFEEYARIPTKVEIGSEFRYKQPVVNEHTAVIALSQSGETADTVASLREAKRMGAPTLGIVNVVGSTIAREVEAGAYIHAGPEISVASTKAFMGMLTMLALFTVALGRKRGMSFSVGKRIVDELALIPEKIQMVLAQSEHPKKIAEKYKTYEHAYYFGRKYQFGIAREGAQKIKEVAYVHAEGYHTGELKHGPLAVVDERFYSLFIMPKDSVYEKNLSNLQELKARNGKAIVITTEGNRELEDIADDVIYIPKTLEMLTPLLSVVPLQLLAYHTAVARGCDVDQPRNLAKSVTVE